MNENDLNLLREAKTLKGEGVIDEAEHDRLRRQILRPSGSASFRAGVEIASKLAWPILALLAIFLFYKPLRTKISESQEIGLGSFVLKIRETARSTGNAELADLLGKLSEDAIIRLMNVGQSNIGLVVRDRTGASGQEKFYLVPDISVYEELERHGLFSASEPIGDVRAFFASLHPTSEQTMTVPTGMSAEDAVRTNSLVPETRHYVNSAALAQEDRARIDQFAGNLTPKGKMALTLITRVVSDQLTVCRPVETESRARPADPRSDHAAEATAH